MHCVAVEVANEDSDAMVIESDENDSTQVVNIFTQILLRSTYYFIRNFLCMNVVYLNVMSFLYCIFTARCTSA